MPPYVCPVCGAEFGTQVELDIHMLRWHAALPPFSLLEWVLMGLAGSLPVIIVGGIVATQELQKLRWPL